MTISRQGLSRSTSVKLFVIALLILILLIPMSMIRGVINERKSIGAAAQRDIMNAWGKDQVVSGPILMLPYKERPILMYGESREVEKVVYVLPDTLNIDAAVEPDIRYRGLHEVPVYSATLRFDGVFGDLGLDELGVDATAVDWRKASLVVVVSDPGAITATPEINVDGQTARFGPAAAPISGFGPQISTAMPVTSDGGPVDSDLGFEMVIELNGTSSLHFLPLGDTTSVDMRSSWASPSFSGASLPEEREIGEDGFAATWRIASLGRQLPSQWIRGTVEHGLELQSAFGVSLYMPVGIYQLSTRATKYAILFVGLTFVTYFLFEVLAKLRLHPLQYLLVGLANTLFYLLLLSLAEHVRFGWAYVVSAFVSCALISAYSASVLRAPRRALWIAAALSGLYGFLYMTLRAETYALLAGAVGLWSILAIIMYLTRHVDWYEFHEIDAAPDGSPQGLQDR